MKVEIAINKKYEDPKVVICNGELTQEIKDTYQSINSLLNDKLKLYKNQDRDIEMIPQAHIIRAYVEDKKVWVDAIEGVYLSHLRLYELEEVLDSRQFIRISNSELVNVTKIVKLDTSVTGTIKMVLNGDIETYVSRRNVTRIKKFLGV